MRLVCWFTYNHNRNLFTSLYCWFSCRQSTNLITIGIKYSFLIKAVVTTGSIVLRSG